LIKSGEKRGNSTLICKRVLFAKALFVYPFPWTMVDWLTIFMVV